MRLVELSTRKGAPVWVNPDQVFYIAPPDGAGGSMYGDSNVGGGAKIFFTQGANLDVRETVAETVARLTA